MVHHSRAKATESPYPIMKLDARDADVAELQLTPVSCEFTVDNTVRVELRSDDGSVVHAIMSPTALLSFVNMATATINERTSQFISSIA